MASFFRSNSQATPLQKLIEKATDANQTDEDWDSIMKICDYVTIHDEHAKEAMQIIRKRLQINPTTSGWRSIALTLTLLEALTKNCGKRFHLQIAQKDFLREFRAVLVPKNSPPANIQEKILSLIQTWALAFRDDHDLKTVEQFYQECKQQGIDFPPAESDSIIKAAISTKPSIESPLNYNRSTSQPAAGLDPRQPHQTVNERVVVRQITAEQVAKLRSELDVVQVNGEIFGEMLVTLQPGEEHSQDFQLLTELYKTCKQMQLRIIDLLSQMSLDDITVDLLRYNDEFNHSFKAYESYVEERQRRLDLASSQIPISNPSPFPIHSNVSTHSSSQQNNEPALIKFDDESAKLTTSLNNLHVESKSLNAEIKTNSQHTTRHLTIDSASVTTRSVSNEQNLSAASEHQNNEFLANFTAFPSKTADQALNSSASSMSDKPHTEQDTQFNIPAPLANDPNA